MRNFSERMFIDEFSGQLQLEFQLLWIGLLMIIADDQGRMLDNAAEIRAQIFPHQPQITDEIIEAGLTLYSEKHKIHRYSVGSNGSGRRLIQIINWWRYQKHSTHMGRSQYPPPPKWVDRVCTHDPGSKETVKVNWDKEGGFPPFTERHYRATNTSIMKENSITTETPVKQKSREVEVKYEVEVEDEYKNPPTPLPPSPTMDKKAVGGRAGRNSIEPSVDLKNLKPKQRKAADQIARILRSSGLSERKINTLIYKVAIRILKPDPITYTLAALAGAYADPKVNNKPAVAAYRIENNQIDPAYLVPDTWCKLPKNILKAAGIDDIDAFLRETKYGRMNEMIAHLRGE